MWTNFLKKLKLIPFISSSQNSQFLLWFLLPFLNNELLNNKLLNNECGRQLAKEAAMWLCSCVFLWFLGSLWCITERKSLMQAVLHYKQWLKLCIKCAHLNYNCVMIKTN